MASEPAKVNLEEEVIGLARTAGRFPEMLVAVDQEGVQVGKKFTRLRDEWKAQRGHEPSTMKVVMLPAYQKIIGMGPAVVPFLLRELETNLDNWFWALMSITEANPVPEEMQGDGEAMAQAWWQWAKERGYEW